MNFLTKFFLDTERYVGLCRLRKYTRPTYFKTSPNKFGYQTTLNHFSQTNTNRNVYLAI